MSFPRSAALVFLIGIAFLASMLVATGGRPSLPLDDSFIYFQYARQAAAGEFFSYHPGDAATTGSTSVPWMLILALGALLGMNGKAMIFVAMGLAGVFLAVA
ncbi:MAG: hypothetical protein HKN12_10890, partial [Gemmatimonadetes bacterium]|nr:hypothetical protein [Gemmatimonadota bacterium]